MDRREFLKTAGAGVLGLTGVAYIGANRKSIAKYIMKDLQSDGKYDFTDDLLNNMEELLYGNIEYKTKIKYKLKEGKAPREEENFGCGFRVGNKLITADHLITMEELRENTPFGVYKIPVDTLDRKVYFPDGEGEIIYRNPENDLALIEMPSEHGREYPLGNSDELEPGHIISSVGKSDSIKEIVKTSRIVSKDGDYQLLISKKMGPENVFLVWAQNYPGDSGGPVYAFRDGNPEVVGQILAVHRGIGEDRKINHIKKLLKKYI